jgi:hypothetical protein
MFGGKYGRLRLLVCVLMLTMLLSGCMVMNSADLLSPPRLHPDHAELLKLVNEETSGSNWATTSPQAGTNRSPVQFIDLHQDGIPEAIVFLANPIDVQLQVVIYSKTGESKFKKLTSFPLKGGAFNRVEYADLNNDGILEIIIGQSFGAESSYAGSVYTLVNDEPMVVLQDTPYTSLYVYDLNDDDRSELLLLNHDESGNNAYAELYGLNLGDDAMHFLGKAPLSAGIRTPDRIIGGRLNAHIPTVIVDGFSSVAAGLVSDVLILSENGLENISFTPIDNYSRTTFRSLEINAMDVDFDGFLEIPVVVKMPQPQKVKVQSDSYIYWYAYDKSFSMALHCATYPSQTDNWYLLYPDEWIGKVYTQTSESKGIRTTTFSMEYNGFQFELLSIYSYPTDQPLPAGENRSFLVLSQGRRFYASLPNEVKLGSLPEQYRISNIADVRKRFAIIDFNGDNKSLADFFPVLSYDDDDRNDR